MITRKGIRKGISPHTPVLPALRDESNGKDYHSRYSRNFFCHHVNDPQDHAREGGYRRGGKWCYHLGGLRRHRCYGW